MKYPSLIVYLGILCWHPSGLAHPGGHETIAHFSQQIALQPKQQAPYILRGIAYSNDGQFDKALADFQRAEELGDPALASFDLGVLYYRMGEFATARGYFDAVLEKQPNHTQCLEYRARSSREDGDYASAIADFRRFIELQPQPNPGHYISTAEMLSTTGPGGIEQALAVLDQGSAQIGITPQLGQYAIELELQRGRPDRAMVRQDQLQPILGDTPDWKVDKAELLLQTGDREQAVALLEAASSQLQTLRKTPARLATQDRIDRLLNSPG